MVDNGESPFAAYASAIDRVVTYVCRRNRLSADDADEFAGAARLKLIEDDCAVLRAFEGRSSIQTYLTVVIQRLFLDFRVRQWGKWRPSAEARRLGPTAMLFEKLTARDGLTAHEARQAMRTNHQVVETDTELDAIEARLPPRIRRRVVSDEELATVAGSSHDGEALVLEAEAETDQARSYAALERALADLPNQDRLILKYRFEHALQVAEIARLMRLEQKPLYRRIEAVLRGLRVRLEAEGLDAEGLRSMFGNDSARAGSAWVLAGNREERPSL